ncbi:unnamed protein product [Gongylonema pulchrum]|uniref:DZF domain-containing protein n=1 Tax=Gongylonema pulchrum TaxID=637853 RepID=A0A183EEI4_9BILA|nr:unnamed protein product [Gongylonema pulchrum]
MNISFALQDRGTHIVKTDPSAEVVETLATNLEQLVEYALLALRDTLPAEDNLSKKNTTIAVVGKGMPFKVMDDDDVQPYLDRIANVPRTGQHGTAEVSPLTYL